MSFRWREGLVSIKDWPAAEGLAVLFMFLDELCGRELAAGRLRRVSCGWSDRSFAGGRQSKCRLFVVLKNRRGRCVVGKVGP